MNYPAKVITCAAAAFLLHLLLGWAWTLGAGVGAGLWHGRGGWLLGATAVAVDWTAWLVYDYSVNARAVHLMTQTMGDVLGNMPFFVVVALTLSIGVALGGLGGAVGTQVRRVLDRTRNVPA